VSGIITFTKAGDFWLNPTTGVVTTVLFVAIGLLLRRIRIKRELSAGVAKDSVDRKVLVTA